MGKRQVPGPDAPERPVLTMKNVLDTVLAVAPTGKSKDAYVEEVSAALDVGTSAARVRVKHLVTYGFANVEGDALSLTARGGKIMSASERLPAFIEAFLAQAVYVRVLMEFDGPVLTTNTRPLDAFLANCGVGGGNVVAKVRRAMVDNAQACGMIDHASRGLRLPSGYALPTLPGKPPVSRRPPASALSPTPGEVDVRPGRASAKSATSVDPLVAMAEARMPSFGKGDLASDAATGDRRRWFAMMEAVIAFTSGRDLR